MLSIQFTTLASHLVSNPKHTRLFNIFQKSGLYTILHFCYNSLYITHVKLKSYFRITIPKDHRKVDNMQFKYSLHATGKKIVFCNTCTQDHFHHSAPIHWSIAQNWKKQSSTILSEKILCALQQHFQMAAVQNKC